MKREMCKRVFVMLLAFMLCAESTLAVAAAENGSIMAQAGFISEKMPEGMELFDISEEAIAAAEVSEEEFMQQFGFDQTQIEAAETEMERALGISAPVAEAVSANTLSANSAQVSQEKATTYATLEDAADYMREKMVARKDLITIRVAGNKDSALKNVKTILNKVYEYDKNGAPDEGDYLYWHMKYMSWTNPKKNSDGSYTIRFKFIYRTTAAEEKYVTKKVNAIVKNLNLKSTALNDYQKVRAIYDYIMSIVEYDHYHYNTDQTYNYMYTTYEALNSGFAVCQAYATLFYRLCEEAGISARVICGNDDAKGSPTHGWNIVKIGSHYYNLDATWDDSADARTHVYFLKNMAEFTGHQRNKVNAGTAFDKQFPTSPVSYPTPEADISGKLINAANISGSVALVNGTDYSLTANNGRAKVIFFMNPAETGSTMWTQQFFEINAIKAKACDSVLIDIFDGYAEYEEGKPRQIMQLVMSIVKESYAYNFSSDYVNGLAYRNQYALSAGVQSGCHSSVAIIDGNNRLRYFGYADAAMTMIEKVLMEISYNAPYGAMTGVNAVQTQNDQVQLSWNPYGGATGYRVYRKIGAGAYCCVGTTTSTSFVDQISSTGTYTYQIKAIYSSKDIASTPEKMIAIKTMLLKKGKTYTVDGYKYKVLKSTNKTKTVAFAGVSNKKLSKVLIPDSVKINGLTYKVTEISAKALKGNKKVKTVSIGKNVTKIGKQAFYNTKKLANIVVKTKNLKSVGSKALYGISKKAEIRVPTSKYKKYQKVFKGKGQKSSVKIKK